MWGTANIKQHHHKCKAVLSDVKIKVLIRVASTIILFDNQVLLVGRKDSSMMSGTKGFLSSCNYFPNVFTNWVCVSSQTLTLVAFGISKVVDSTFTPTSVSFLGR